MSKAKAKKALLGGSGGDTKRVRCYCENEFQDKIYGHMKRIANRTARDGIYRCTVCGKDVTI